MNMAAEKIFHCEISDPHFSIDVSNAKLLIGEILKPDEAARRMKAYKEAVFIKGPDAFDTKRLYKRAHTQKAIPFPQIRSVSRLYKEREIDWDDSYYTAYFVRVTIEDLDAPIIDIRFPGFLMSPYESESDSALWMTRLKIAVGL